MRIGAIGLGSLTLSFLGACAGPSSAGLMSAREYQGLGYCVGLYEGSGKDAGPLIALAAGQRALHRSRFDPEGFAINRDAARDLARSGRGAQAEALQRVISAECSGFARYGAMPARI